MPHRPSLAAPGAGPALIFAATFPTLAAWTYFVGLRDASFVPALYAGSKLLQFSFPVVWVLVAEPRGETAGRAKPRGVGLGLGSGVLLAAGMGALYALVLRGGALAAEAAPRLVDKLEDLGAASPLRFLALALFLSLLHSGLEEYYWRWFVYGRLRRRWGTVSATTLASLAFMAHHVVILDVYLGPDHRWTVTPLFSLAVASAGALWCWQYERTGGLRAAWVSHALADLALMAIGWDLVRSAL